MINFMFGGNLATAQVHYMQWIVSIVDQLKEVGCFVSLKNILLGSGLPDIFPLETPSNMSVICFLSKLVTPYPDVVPRVCFKHLHRVCRVVQARWPTAKLSLCKLMLCVTYCRHNRTCIIHAV